jgi:hypothetical protein
MKNIFTIILALVVLSACDNGDDRNVEGSQNDSLSRVQQKQRTDSLKRANPLLILPPDSTYTGTYIDKYPGGITKFTGFYRFGKRHGHWVSFYPSGQPWSEMHYDKGLRHGPNITYFTNGQKRFEGVYKNDKQDSIWVYYDSTGTMAERVLFKNSRLVKRLTAETEAKK